MTFDNGDDGERRRRPGHVAEQDFDDHPKTKGSRKRAPSPELGRALRNAYDRTIKEEIPPEMLDLLGKLG